MASRYRLNCGLRFPMMWLPLLLRCCWDHSIYLIEQRYLQTNRNRWRPPFSSSRRMFASCPLALNPIVHQTLSTRVASYFFLTIVLCPFGAASKSLYFRPSPLFHSYRTRICENINFRCSEFSQLASIRHLFLLAHLMVRTAAPVGSMHQRHVSTFSVLCVRCYGF